MKYKYLVFGTPIEHSKSPFIHTQFADQFNIDQNNDRKNPAKDLKTKDAAAFKEDVENFFTNSGTYCNVTLPYKSDACDLVLAKKGKLSERAQLAQAVNTIFMKDGKWHGDNTDGVGLLRDLEINHKLPLKGKNILIISAGGATQGILQPLLKAQPQSLVLANRTPETPQKLAQHFSTIGKITPSTLDDFGDQKFDVIIHASSVGTKGSDADKAKFKQQLLKLKGLIDPKTTIAYDLSYGKSADFFLQIAAEIGIQKSKCFDGLGMLVEQAAEAFWLAHGERPNTAAVIADARAGK